MREALLRIASDYAELVGTSKILLLFVISMLTVILLDENISDNEQRRHISPAVFLLSLWGGISYAFVRIIPRNKKISYLAGMLIMTVTVALSGGYVLSGEALELSVYHESSFLKTALSVILILISFIICYLISAGLFEEKQDRVTFMTAILLLNLFGFYSEKAIAFSLFLSPISAGAIVVHVVMPALLWLYLKFEDKIQKLLFAEDNNTGDNEEIPEEWDMKKHKILNIRNMAIAFAALLVVFMATVFVLNNKINSLYDATLQLEKAANTKMTVTEVTDDDGSVIMTLMVSPEGIVTAIGGGARENGDACYDAISKYTDNVDRWYVYGDDEENKGAYRECKEKGITVDEVYLISGIERLK